MSPEEGRALVGIIVVVILVIGAAFGDGGDSYDDFYP